jgi:hypothetical protein
MYFFLPALIAPFSSFGSQFGKRQAHEDRQLTGPQALLDELLAIFDISAANCGLGAVEEEKLDTIVNSLSFWFCFVLVAGLCMSLLIYSIFNKNLLCCA